MPGVHHLHMHTRFVDGVTIRPLRNGDTGTVSAALRAPRRALARSAASAAPSRASPRSSSRISPASTTSTTSSSATSTAIRSRSGSPASSDSGTTAEIAFAVADAHQSRGIGSILAGELAADARAAGITELVATVCGDNPRVLALLKRLGSLSLTWRGGERELVVGLEH